MITPKEKAEELYFKFYSKIPSIQDEGQMQDEASKQCALIAVDEVLRGVFYAKDEVYDYYMEVKLEIDKL